MYNIKSVTFVCRTSNYSYTCGLNRDCTVFCLWWSILSAKVCLGSNSVELKSTVFYIPHLILTGKQIEKYEN